MSGPLLVCLLPVRNGQSVLERWLSNVVSFADCVVALDDGSSDDTVSMLRDSSLVTTLLVNPVRPSYHGWNDGDNRRRLLEGAAVLNPQFVLSLDADETIYEDDTVRLRNFLEHDALSGCAYGLHHVRCWGEGTVSTHVDTVFRLFGYRNGQEFQRQQLHFSPIPTSIRPSMWFQTSLRLLHHGAASVDDIASRRAKYGEADPENAFGAGHEFFGLHQTPQSLGTITPKPSDAPILIGPALS